MEQLIQKLEVKFSGNGNSTGVFEGYGAYFNNTDSYGDVIIKGAFVDTLNEWKKQGKLPPMLSQHGGWQMSPDDMIPIGKWTHMEEDSKGLYVKGKLINLDTERGKQIYGAMNEGVLDGMSIGYRAKEFTLGSKSGEPKRTLKKIDLHELSIVTFPANGKALISSIKSSIRDFEKALVMGTLPPLTAKEAKALLAEGYKAFQRDRVGSISDELAEIILNNTKFLKG